MVRPCQDGPISGKMMGSRVETQARRAEAGRRNDEFPNDECRMSKPQVSAFIRHSVIRHLSIRKVPLGSRQLLGVDLCQLLFA